MTTARLSGLIAAIVTLAALPVAHAQTPPVATSPPGVPAPTQNTPSPAASPEGADPTAQVPSPPIGEDNKTRAAALFAEGNRLLGEASYPEALEKFRAAYKLYSSPKLLLNIGTTLRQLGRSAAAAQAYEEYLRAGDVSADRASEVRRVLAEIDAVVGWVRVEVDPPDATLRLDGETVTVTSGVAMARVEPGEHQVTAQKPGMSSAVQTISVAPREASVLRVRLSSPDRRAVVVVQGQSNPQRQAGWAVSLSSLVGLGVGAGMGILAFSEAGEVRKECYHDTDHCTSEAIGHASSAKTLATASTAAFVAGGVALAVGVTLLLTAKTSPDSRSPAPTMRLNTAIGPGSVGGQFEVSF